MALRVRVHKVDGGTVPVRGSAHAAGYDLAAAHDVTVPARGRVRVRLGLDLWLPKNCYGRVAARSGLAAKSHLDVDGAPMPAVAADAYITLVNHSAANVALERGDRVAQLILEHDGDDAIAALPVQMVSELPDTARGSDGFGSTGRGGDIGKSNGSDNNSSGGGANATGVDASERKSEGKTEGDSKRKSSASDRVDTLYVHFVSPNARLTAMPEPKATTTPTISSATATAAITVPAPHGHVLHASASVTVPARGKALVPLGFANAIPAPGMYGRVSPLERSPVSPGAGIIDADYRGELRLVAFNHADQEVVVSVGDAVAQYHIRRIYTPAVETVV